MTKKLKLKLTDTINTFIDENNILINKKRIHADRINKKIKKNVNLDIDLRDINYDDTLYINITNIINDELEIDFINNIYNTNTNMVVFFDANDNDCYNTGSTITWTDLSDYNNGDVISGATYNINSFYFNPSSDINYISTKYNNVMTDFTVIIWFKDDGIIKDSERLVDKNIESGFWLGRSGTSANIWGGGVMDYGRFLTLTDGEWHFLASVRSGITHILYADGITNTISGIVNSGETSNDYFIIGNQYTKNLNSFGGNIAYVKLYDIALSSDEILDEFNELEDIFNT